MIMLFKTSRIIAPLILAVTLVLTPGNVLRAGDSRPIRIIAFGDSLIAGYGLRPQDAFPEQLEATLKANQPDIEIEIINAGVSGDTSAAGLARLNWALPKDVDGAIVLLGGNDFLRGLSPGKMRGNLDAILTALRKRKLNILLLGMKAPRNTGKEYYTAFDAAYPHLAEKHGALLDPFFLEGIAGTREFNQIDGLHPNARGVAKIVNRLVPKVEELIARIRARRETGEKS